MIIKKFQIPCPLPLDEDLNDTMKVVNASLPQVNATAVDYSEDACTPKYFVFNSQVKISIRPLDGGRHKLPLSVPFDRFVPSPRPSTPSPS